MRQINDCHRLSREQQRELPNLRRCVPSTLVTADIIDLLTEKNADLARLLIEAAPIMDLAPSDLKVFIVSAFGVTAREYQNYEIRRQRAKNQAQGVE